MKKKMKTKNEIIFFVVVRLVYLWINTIIVFVPESKKEVDLSR